MRQWDLPDWAKAIIAIAGCLFLIHWWSSGAKNALAWGALIFVVVRHVRAGRDGKYTGRIPRISLHAPVAAYLLVTLAASAASPMRFEALSDWLKLAELAAGYLVLATLLARQSRAHNALRALAGAFLVYLCINVVRYTAGLHSGQWAWGERWNGSLLGYITHAAGVSVTMMFVACGLIAASKNKWEKAAGILLAGISLSFNFAVWQVRSAQLATALGAVLLAMLLCRNKAAGIAIGCGAAALIAAGLLATGGGRWVAGSILANDRFDLWSKTASAIAEKPILGHGVGPKVFSRWYDTYPPDQRIVGSPGHPHNMELQVLYESGVVGLAAWAWLWIALFRSLGRSLRRIHPPIRHAVAGLTAAMAAFLIYGQFSAALSLRPALLFWSLLGIAGAFEASRTDEGPSEAPAAR